ncbi:MAG: molecular chaperone HtpG [Oscillospiraceae bacterium]|nr:molecular chaperone HtpG [Oscillospiraceae bacterium]
MAKKQFKAESKKLMDMMINSIYTHKEIFLRELISNASDAMDKLYFRSLTDDSIKLTKEDYRIKISADKDNRTLTIEDNGCGMNRQELENNLGTIAKSGSFDFKNENKAEDINIIGQFGVGFYSAFMVSDKVVVKSRPYGSDEAYSWTSEGVDGYTIEPCIMDEYGTKVILHIKEDTEDNKYSEYLDQYTISNLVKKYSDFIHYPIKMMWKTSQKVEGSENEYQDVFEERTLNSMVPIWKKSKDEVTEEEYNSFYKEQYMDFEDPAKVIHSKVEGRATFTSLLFIPARAPYDYYTKEFEKGLSLYSSGVLIMDECADLLPDYFSFVKGLVDSEDLSLNISREMLQHDRQLKIIAKNIEKKIKNELLKMQKDEREKYEKVFNSFGRQLKLGVYDDFGAHKDELQDLLMFTSSFEKKMTTFKEYCDRMKEGQNTIYYACGETVDQIDLLPQAEAVKDKGYEILYLTDNIDEFVLQMMQNYDGKAFANISNEKLDIDTDEEKERLKTYNEENKDVLRCMKEDLAGKVRDVKFTNRLKSHPVCLTNEGMLSVEMEKTLNTMPTGGENVKAQLVMEINKDHPIAAKLKELYESDKETLAKYTKILYAQARLIEGLTVENPAELSNMVCDLML